MSYTVLRVEPEGVVLHAEHRRRFAAERKWLDAFDRFAATATPGIYSLEAVGDTLRAILRPASRLTDGIPTRFAISPFASLSGAFAKPAPPCGYDDVRQPGVATLLTDAGGREFYESCSASIVSWDGARLVFVPDDRPRVLSTTERVLRSDLPHIARPVAVDSDEPLGLLNAVKGLCVPACPGRQPFPSEARALIADVLATRTRRRP